MSLLAEVLIRGLRSAQPAATDVSPGSLYFVTDEGVTEQSDGTTWNSYSGTGGAITAVNISAGTTSHNLASVVFSNSNGVSFGLNGSTITGSHNGLTSQSNQAFSASGGSSAFQTINFANSNGFTFSNSVGSVIGSFSTLVFSNSNGVSFGVNAGTLTASVAAAAGNVNISAGTTSNNLTNLVFSNSNNVTFGLNGSTITASISAAGGAAPVLSYFQNYDLVSTTVVLNGFNNLSRLDVVPFILPYGLTADYLRGPLSLAAVQNLFPGTTANSTWTADQRITFANVIYSNGTGASSDRIMSMFSSSAGLTFQTIGGAAGVGSNYTLTMNISYPVLGTTSTFSTSYASTAANWDIESSAISNFNSMVFLDQPFATSMSAGRYWVAFGMSSISSSTGAPSFASSFTVGLSSHGLQTQMTAVQPHQLGAASGVTYGWEQGFGSFSTNAALISAASIAFNKISTTGPLAYFQLAKNL